MYIFCEGVRLGGGGFFFGAIGHTVTMASASANGLAKYHDNTTTKIEKARTEVARLNRFLNGTNAYVSLTLPTPPELPPEVWAAIASYTRGTRTPLRIGQVNQASREGVTKKAPRLWRTLERKYGISPSTSDEGETAARDNVANYLVKKDTMKRELLTFGKTSEPTRLQNKDLEQVLRDVEGLPLRYRLCATALVEGPDTRKIALPPWFSGIPARLAMACLCAAHAAVGKTMNILIVIGQRGGTTSEAKTCLLDLLNGFFTDCKRKGVYDPNLQVFLCNSSTIWIYGASSINLPDDEVFDAAVACAIRTDEMPNWIYPMPTRCVYFD